MPRVVVTKNGDEVLEAASVCPVSCFRKDPATGRVVINPNDCIDCGACQGVAPEGTILEDSEASEEDIKFNADNAENWEAI